jgi:phosphoribosyl 1,2-cyclic phosphodiesterase
MRVTVLASGSKGNSTLVASSHTRILVDAGLSCRELLKRLRTAGETPETLDAILITHEHASSASRCTSLRRRIAPGSAG